MTLIEMLEKQNIILARARKAYLLMEASRKHEEAKLTKQALGKSHAEKVINAQSEEVWLKFHLELARLESIFEFQKMKMEILNKSWLEEYLTKKLDDGLIRKQG
jgi:outer membrane PBP1 activator LpoA protein